MRTAFIETLCELAAADPRIYLLTGDLGFSVLEVFRGAISRPLRQRKRRRAEHDRRSRGAGNVGRSRLCSHIRSPTFRRCVCLELIRNDVCHHESSVKVVAVGGGLSYGGNLGYTHHGIEDLAIMRLAGHGRAASGDPRPRRHPDDRGLAQGPRICG